MQQLETTTLAEGDFLRLKKNGRWEYAERTNSREAVLILAITDDHRLLLVEQHRVAMDRNVIELPAGLVGDIAGEENEQTFLAAQRELLEETGYEADHFVQLAEGPISPGLTNEMVVLVLASGLRKVGPGGGDGHEQIVAHAVPLEEVPAWLEEQRQLGKLIDLKIYAGLYFAMQNR